MLIVGSPDRRPVLVPGQWWAQLVGAPRDHPHKH